MNDIKNNSDIEAKLKKGDEITISFKYPTDDIILSINSILAKVLSSYDSMFILDSLITILRELIVNAVKANSKRVYFEIEKLNMEDPADYQSGMMKFMSVVMKKLDHFQDDLNRNRYTINISIKVTPDGISIIVANNIELLPIELERITIRRQSAAQYDNFSDAYSAFYDPSEGAGLGIILIVFLLRNAGIDVSSFNIFQDHDSVKTTIFIPFKLRKPEISSVIKEKIIEQVNSLPTFPENLVELQNLCSRKDTSIREIASKIVMDPSLTADILRIANTAGYYSGKKIDDINEAVMRIGLKTLESFFMVLGSKEILSKRYKHFKQVWEHSSRISILARIIAADFGFKYIADKIFISALLHDIGKIVLLSTDKHLIEEIAEIIKNRDIISSAIIEEVSIGISHAAIGALIAEKWNFPDYIVNAIRHHHSPLGSMKKHRTICQVVYLANMIAGIIEKKYHYQFIESEILKKFKFSTREVLDRYIEKLNNDYAKYLNP